MCWIVVYLEDASEIMRSEPSTGTVAIQTRTMVAVFHNHPRIRITDNFTKILHVDCIANSSAMGQFAAKNINAV